jgi:nitrite reductase/ring-hydroxylating ferredoxin subunit
MDRRRFVTLGGAAILGAACGGLEEQSPRGADGGDAGAGTGSSSGSSSGAAARDSGALADGGPAADAPLESGSGSGGDDAGGCAVGTTSLVLSFAQYPQLAGPWGSVQAIAPGYSDPVCGQANVIVVSGPSPGSAIALSGSCTLACCILAFDGTQLVCPCHDATFDLGGHCTSGFAPPLVMLAVCVDAEGITVTW